MAKDDKKAPKKANDQQPSDGQSKAVDSDATDEAEYAAQAAAAEFKAKAEAEAKTADAEQAAQAAAALPDDEVVIDVPSKFILNLQDGKSMSFLPGTRRVKKWISEHPYVKAHGCKVV